MTLSSPEKDRLIQSGYRLVGKNEHSAVEVCRWTKKSILDEGICYKQKFYEDIHGIKSHRCLQMTPSLPFCDNRCVFCWRDADLNKATWDGPVDEPSKIIEEAIEAQQELLSGFGGNPKADKEKWKEAQDPNLSAISLDGEPTIYPELSGLIDEFRKRNIVPFLVTNGLHPDRLEEIVEPDQLYVSVVAPDEKTYSETCRPLVARPWEKLNETLELLPSLDCIKVLRLTLVNELNMKNLERYGELIEQAEPDYVEPKGYVAVGHSRERLGPSFMPTHEEIQSFGEKISELTGYDVVDESEPSRIVLLKS